MMSMQTTIEQKLLAGLTPSYMRVENESHMHNVPDNAETHFKLVLVSEKFAGLRPVQRHQQVYHLLSQELQAGVHALAIHTFDAEEWCQRQNVPASPECLG